MKTVKSANWTIGTGALVAILTLVGCGGTESAQQYTIPLKVTVEEKAVYVDNFLNLTENDDLNIFEDGVADMLEQSLAGITSVRIVPRLTVKKTIAVSELPGNRDATIEAASANGARYIVDGWITRAEAGSYRIYANILNLDTRELQEKIAVAEFLNRDEALPKISDFVQDITSKLSQSRESIEQLSDFRLTDYEVYRMRMLAFQSASRGRPEVAASLLEQALLVLEEKLAKEKDEVLHKKRGDNIGKIRFSLAEIYTEMRDHERALAHLETMMPHIDLYPEAWQSFIRALWDENNGNLDKAEKVYREYLTQYPHEGFFYRRLADIALAKGAGRTAAIAILEDGLKKSPETSGLTRRIAELKLAVEGDRAIEEFVFVSDSGDRNAALASEVFSSMINVKMEQDFLRDLPTLVPIVIHLDNGGKTGETGMVQLGSYKIDTSKIEQGLDYSCPDTTAMAVRIAGIAARTGNKEFAWKLATAIDKFGSAPNSKDAYHTIAATVSLLDGKFKEAKQHAFAIDENDPSRYLVIGNILIHQGNTEKGVVYMEKALHLEKKPHPIVYYYVANAHMLAGHYKEWNEYNRKFLEVSAAQNLVPEKIKERIAAFAALPPPPAPKELKRTNRQEP